MSAPGPAVVARLRAAGCVFAEEEADLLLAAASSEAGLAAMVDARVSGLPLEQVVGWAEFCGRRVVLEPGVFVPRRRSEFLVRHAVAATRPGAVVVDLCCGSGALGAAIAAAVAGVELHAADVDPVAVRCARRNVPAGAEVHLGDLDAALPARLVGRVDVLVAVAPYVPTDAVALMPPEARLHEPRTALDGGTDGLDVVRGVVDAASRCLASGGTVLLEVAEHQVPATEAALRAHGLDPRVETDRDDDGDTVATVVRGVAGERRAS